MYDDSCLSKGAGRKYEQFGLKIKNKILSARLKYIFEGFVYNKP